MFALPVETPFPNPGAKPEVSSFAFSARSLFRPSEMAWPADQPGPQGLRGADALFPPFTEDCLAPFLISAGPHPHPTPRAGMAGRCKFRRSNGRPSVSHSCRVTRAPNGRPLTLHTPYPFQDFSPGKSIKSSQQDCLRAGPQLPWTTRSILINLEAGVVIGSLL